MIFSIQLLDRAPEIDPHSRRRFRQRNHLFDAPGWGRAEKTIAGLRGILIDSLKKGARAAGQMATPIAAVQALMIALVAATFLVSPVQDFFETLVSIKLQMGLPFAFLSMGAIAVFTECIRRIGSSREPFVGPAAYGFLVFGFLGVTTDLFCGLQENVWGGLSPAPQVIAKMLADQFIYTVLFANPYQTILYVWKDCRFSRSAFLRRTQPVPQFYAQEMLPVLVTNWAFWIPTSLVLYCLPMDIQFIIKLLAIVIWILLLTALTKRA